MVKLSLFSFMPWTFGNVTVGVKFIKVQVSTDFVAVNIPVVSGKFVYSTMVITKPCSHSPCFPMSWMTCQLNLSVLLSDFWKIPLLFYIDFQCIILHCGNSNKQINFSTRGKKNTQFSKDIDFPWRWMDTTVKTAL